MFNSSVKQENSLRSPHDELIHIDLKGEPRYQFLTHPSRTFQYTSKHISAYFIFLKKHRRIRLYWMGSDNISVIMALL